jgi:hypothetical protein
MQGCAVLRAFNLVGAPIDLGDCFGTSGTNDNASFTSEVRVGYVRHVSPDCPGDWWSREINISEYQLYRWLRDHGADEGETVLVCWAGGAS